VHINGLVIGNMRQPIPRHGVLALPSVRS